MNELQVKTINLSPAVVEFNIDELSQMLDSQLAKYEGLEFTEQDAAACKKTITELNKGKKALNDYRLKTKKELTAPVTSFENQCKELATKFDSVINPLKEQHEEFEEERKAKKRAQIAPIIEGLIEKEGLSEKYINQLIDIPKEYFNKSKTIKAITKELIDKAHHLGIQQDKEEADQEIIKSHVELVNAKYDVNLLESSYVMLIETHGIGEIKHIIENHAQLQVEKAQKKAEVTQQAKVNKFEQVPLSSASGHIEDDEIYAETYQVEGTEDQLQALEEYMSSNGITWKVMEA